MASLGEKSVICITVVGLCIKLLKLYKMLILVSVCMYSGHQ
jgi:hypothetical protein